MRSRPSTFSQLFFMWSIALLGMMLGLLLSTLLGPEGGKTVITLCGLAWIGMMIAAFAIR